MKIELLYFEGCPSWKEAEKNLKAVMEELRLTEPVQYIRVETNDQAGRHRFIGSPTIRINGLDIDPAAQNLRNYFLGCRVYNIEGTPSGWPSQEMIREGLLHTSPE